MQKNMNAFASENSEKMANLVCILCIHTNKYYVYFHSLCVHVLHKNFSTFYWLRPN